MRFFATVILLGALVLGSNANAEIFIKRDRGNDDSRVIAPLSPPPSPEAEQNEPPVEGTLPALPRFESIEDYAQTYTGNCLKQKHPLMSGQTLADFCACTARNIAQNMTLQNVNDLFGQGDEALRQRNRMMINVYAPCMEYPVRAMITARCMADPDLAKAVKSPEELCACAADETAAYVQREAPAALVESLRANPNANDPLSDFMSSDAFNSTASRFLLGCVQKHAL